MEGGGGAAADMALLVDQSAVDVQLQCDAACSSSSSSSSRKQGCNLR